jgi:chromosomal replication initiation ATPase DnaA
MELKRILKAVSEVTLISEEDILSKSRLKETVLARHLYCYFACEKTRYSLKSIGTLINRDHASVIHGNKRILYELEYYPEVKYIIKRIDFKLKDIDDKWLNYHTINNNINISHTL